MANNRIYLVFRPTKEAVYLGKRMDSGYYNVPDDIQERLQQLFEHAEGALTLKQDDFCVALESNPGTCAVELTNEYVLCGRYSKPK
jgi:hypothetical protein